MTGHIMTATDVTTALGYTPRNTAVPVSAAEITAALGYTPASPQTAVSTLVLESRLGRRNVLDNGLFRINQRAAASVTANGGFPADRWLHVDSGNGARTLTQVSLNDADRTAIGDEDARYGVQIVTAGSAGAGDVEILGQALEGANTFAGKQVTFSVWAKAAGANAPLALDLAQTFGVGGSPIVTTIGAHKWLLGTSWTRYQTTFTVPSVAGKTIGPGDALTVCLWTSAGSSSNLRTGTIGAQSSTVTLWAPQLELGSTASPVEKPMQGVDLGQCRRFYQVNRLYNELTATGSGQTIAATCSLTPPMRVPPTVTLLDSSLTVNSAGLLLGAYVEATVAPGSYIGVGVYGKATSSGSGTASVNILVGCSAEL